MARPRTASQSSRASLAPWRTYATRSFVALARRPQRARLSVNISASTSTSANWSQGYTEREQPLLLPHEVLQLDAEHVIAFAGGTPPARLNRIDWRSDRVQPADGCQLRGREYTG